MTQLNAKYWEAPSSNQADFPENSDPELAYQPIQNRPNCGIAFSGGGTVSAALAPGFIKALEDLDLMKNVKYISGVSGGTWGTSAYCFALDSDRRTKYFGTKINPDLSQLNVTDIKKADEKGSMLEAVTDAKIVRLTIENAFLFLLGHESFTRAVGQIFLKPFGLNNKTGYFSCDDNSIQNIKSRNSGLKDSTFLKLYSNPDNPNEDSPYYIMNTTMLTPPQAKTYNKHPFEFTPLYCGMIGNQGKDTTGETIGGYFVEPFAFNTSNPTVNTTEKTITVEEAKKTLILSSPVGTSGSAVEQYIAELRSIFKHLTKFFPAFDYWNPADKDQGNPLKTQQYLFGDGGITEDTGIASLLARKVENIVLFITEPFDTKPISTKKCEKTQRTFGYNQIAQLFGVQKVKESEPKPYTFGLSVAQNLPGQFFKTEDFTGLQQALTTAKDNKEAIVVTQAYEVLENDGFGVEGNWNVNVTWVIVDTCPEFNQGLVPGGIYDSETGKFTIDGLENFPAICTFEQNKGYVIQLTPAQANLLGNQAYWMVATNQKGKAAITKALSPST